VNCCGPLWLTGTATRNRFPSTPSLAAGMTRETAETLGVGVFSGKGSMSGRVVLPNYLKALLAQYH
jgi:hypothetical protein